MKKKGNLKNWARVFPAEGTASAEAGVWHFFKKGKMVGVAKA